MLVGDRDRELATGALRRHFVHGRLTTAELAERVDLALRARSRRDLRAATAGLPLVWEDLPAGVQIATRRARRGMQRVRFLFVLFRVWAKVNLALVLAFSVAVAIGAPLGMTLGAALAACALTGYGLWRVWRRGVSRQA